MKTIEISYNPYKMVTKMLIDGIDVCQNDSYDKFKEFIENEIPLQTWIEPISYLDWQGLVNEVSDPDYNDEVKLVFSGRKIDFDDLKCSIKDQNEERSEETRVIYHYQHKKVLDDKVLSKNIEDVVAELKSDRFRELVSQRTTEGLTQKYEELTKTIQSLKKMFFTSFLQACIALVNPPCLTLLLGTTFFLQTAERVLLKTVESVMTVRLAQKYLLLDMALKMKKAELSQ